MSRAPRPADSGFSVVELLVATLIMLVVMGAVLGLLSPATTAFETQPEVSDVQQQLRVAVTRLQTHLIMAGAGANAGGAAGALGDYFAPVMPYRWGAAGADPPGTFRADTITVLFVPQAPAETAVVGALGSAAAETVFETRPDCGGTRHDLRCGFDAGMRVLLFEPGAAWDIGVAAQVQANALHVVRAGPLSSAYESGNGVATQLAAHTYYLRTDPSTGTFQLMHYDGAQTDLPVVDNVVRLEFRYRGDPAPPQRLPGRPLAEPGPWTTYGPKPPEIGAPSGTSWPDGENCTFAVASGAHVARLPALAASGSGLAELPAAVLTDGPWCPDESHVMRYDADLLRVRRIGITLRVQAGAAFRGPASALFMHAGTARAARRVPDQEVTFAIAPRNLGLER